MVLQYLNAGLVDEFSIALAPVFLNDGLRLFDGVKQAQNLGGHRGGNSFVHGHASPLRS